MSYKNFQSLNAALKQATLSPMVETTRRLFNQVESMTSMAKDLPTSWGRSYSGVMVLKYSQQGDPTDVTETESFAHAIDVPNSLISDVQRRFTEVYNQYQETCNTVNQGIDVDVNLPIGSVGSTMMKQVDNGISVLLSVAIEPDLFFNIGYNRGGSDQHIYGFSTERLDVSDKVLSFGSKYSNQSGMVIQFMSMFRNGNYLNEMTGNINITSITDTVTFGSGTSYFRMANNASPIMLTHPLSVAPNPGWNGFSISGSGVTTASDSSSTDFNKIPRNDLNVNLSDLITINSSAITDLKTAIDAL